MKPSSYTIYNASAGSGKTFTLTKAYLKLLIKAEQPFYFRHILAITFTNKAVGEMKKRVIDMLKAFSNKDSLINPNPMFKAICSELSLEPEQLLSKSKYVLKQMINNYGAINISTIDGFTHRIIRTFALDLQLAVNFEVELDQDALLNEAVDQLIAKTGTDKKLTKVLIDFAMEKADDDKSWDISYDLNKIAKLLISENHRKNLQSLKGKTLEDFDTLKQNLHQKINASSVLVAKEAQRILTLIEEAGLEFSDFSGSYLPKHFLKLSQSNFNVNFETKWQQHLDEKALYPKRVTLDVALVIDSLQPDIFEAFITTKALVIRLKTHQSLYKNITSLSVLAHIQKELETIKEERNILLISEFNNIISKEIKDQPAPFIYERLGEKYKHYFIDEFQDTSKLQWTNLVPLLDNTLASENGSALLVGDAKQAIYRWRGGEAEQFMSLYNNEANPFQVPPKVLSLDTNYRSSKAIINFNNAFFKFIGTSLFTCANYASLYEQVRQKTCHDADGFVNLKFLEFERGDDINLLYAEQTLKTITACIEKNYSPNDICVLVRKRKEGVAIANYLSEQGIKITSSETLLLKNSPKVKVIQAILKLLSRPNDELLHLEVLSFLANQKNIEDKHPFFKSYLRRETLLFFDGLSKLDIEISSHKLLRLPLYELVEDVIRRFNLNNESDAYVQFYLDEVHQFSQKNNSNISGFIDYFEEKQESLSIVAPLQHDAVNIMTIHKSKGLEFPIVIFPFAELNIYRELEPKVWLPLNEEDYNGFSELLIGYNKDLQNFGDIGEALYNERQSELQLDNINLLYVALTRAEQNLFVISKKDINSKGDVNDKTYSGWLIKYLQHIQQWDANELEYRFGAFNNNQKKAEPTNDIELELISTPKESHNLKIVTKSGQLWDTNQDKAIEKGNLVHLALSKIKTSHDADYAVNDLKRNGDITSENESFIMDIINQIINHPQLKSYFKEDDDLQIMNEQDIISTSGLMLRPDRLVINSQNEVVIIDYKTGDPNIQHADQLGTYEAILTEMGYKVTSKLLIYINDKLEIKSA